MQRSVRGMLPCRCNLQDCCCEEYEQCVSCCQDPLYSPGDLSNIHRAPDRCVQWNPVLTEVALKTSMQVLSCVLNAGRRPGSGGPCSSIAATSAGRPASPPCMRTPTCPHITTASRHQVRALTIGTDLVITTPFFPLHQPPKLAPSGHASAVAQDPSLSCGCSVAGRRG